MIAAGRVAPAAYWTSLAPREENPDRAISERTYWLLDPATGRYEKDARWSRVAVAPGMRTAAVLERELPARRIGLLDLASGEVKRWIPVPRLVLVTIGSDKVVLLSGVREQDMSMVRRGWEPVFAER